MIEHKCIFCDQIKESESICTCTNCGHLMYPLPYERKELLISKIKESLNDLILTKIDPITILFYRLEQNKEDTKDNKKYITEDILRFPSYKKILEYISSSNKTEELIERLNGTFEEIEKHFNTPYHMEYVGDYENIYEAINKYEEVLTNAFNILEISFSLPKLSFSKTKLYYEEIPNFKITQSAITILDLLKKLTNKIYKFIKQNNIYGTTYQNYLETRANSNKEQSITVNEITEQLDNIILKNFIVDIFSDGEEELNEMLKSLCDGIETVMSLPVLSKKYNYEYKDNKYTEEDFTNILTIELKSRYDEITNIISNETFLKDKTEEELFNLYIEIININSFRPRKNKKTSLNSESNKKINDLIGLSEVKVGINKIKAYILNNKEHDNLNLNISFLGNTGTGKKKVARIISSILYENSILPEEKIVETNAYELISTIPGETGANTETKINEAIGGVLFIEEVYALINTNYGKEAIDILVKKMDNYRGKICIILAGSKYEINRIINSNPPLKSRIKFNLEFLDYANSEIKEIAIQILNEKGYKIENSAFELLLKVIEYIRKYRDFNNAKTVEYLIEQVIMNQNLRTEDMKNNNLIIYSDIEEYILEENIDL